MSNSDDAIDEALVLFSKRLAMVQGEYNANEKLSVVQRHAEEAQAETKALIAAYVAAECQRAIIETWDYTSEGYNGEYDGLTHIGGKRYSDDEVMEKVVREVMEQLALSASPEGGK